MLILKFLQDETSEEGGGGPTKERGHTNSF